jgi:fibronectin type 3 domain-containing protein
MRNLHLHISIVALILYLTGCNNGKTFNIESISLPKLELPTLSNYRLDPALPIPKNITSKSSISESLLTWRALESKEIVGYRVFKQDNSTKEYKLVATKKDRLSTHYIDKNLLPDHLYRYKISSFTKDGRVSNLSHSVEVVTKPTISVIKSLKAISNLPNRIKLEWDIDFKDSIIEKYIIKRDDGSNKWREIGSVNGSLAAEYFDYDVLSGKSYRYIVVALLHNGVYSKPSITVKANSKHLPLAPKEILATDHLPRKIEITWKDPNKNSSRDIVKYNIYTSSYQDVLFSLSDTTSNPYYIDSIKSDNKEIFYKITAVDSDGLESVLAQKSTRGVTKKSPSRPIINSALIKDGKVVIRWSAGSKEITSYYVVKKYWDGVVYKKLKITGFDSTTFVDDKIKLGKSYKYTVVGVDSNGLDSTSSREVTIVVE